MDFTVFDVRSGAVLRYGICADTDAGGQTRSSTEIVIEGSYSDSDFLIEINNSGPNPLPLDAAPADGDLMPGKLDKHQSHL